MRSDWLWQPMTKDAGVTSRSVSSMSGRKSRPPLLRGISFSDVLEMLCPGDAITTSNIAVLMKRRRA